jgi:hypothetical protein
MQIYHLLQRRALVARAAARSIVAALKSEVQQPTATLELDFAGVEAVTPSFIDELISELSAPGFAQCERIRLLHPPSRLSEKFRAIGRGRGIAMDETPGKDWVIAFFPSTGTAEQERQ